MKIFVTLILSLILGNNLLGQNVDKGLLDTSAQDSNKVVLAAPDNSERVSSTVFFKQYKINATNKKRAKIISLTTLLKEPLKNSSTISSLSAGEIVYLLKLFPKDRV